MISAPVRVIAVQNRVAQVMPTEKSGCGCCASRESCGVSGLGKYFSSRRKTIGVACDAQVRVGDELQLSLSEGDLIKAGLLAYLLPCVTAVAGAALASGYGDVGSAVGAAVGAASGFVLARVSNWAPRVVVQTSSNKGETP
ncbi:SoxR reducing system RseC family protein [Sideroxydans sp.]